MGEDSKLTYAVRPATISDIPDLITHRAAMFREMGIPAQFDEMAIAGESWLRHAIPAHTYRAWVAETPAEGVVASAALIVMPWPPGPISMDPRCGMIFNVYTLPTHRQRGLARRLIETLHEWCRAEGLERVVLNASVFGKPLYDSMGYVVSDEPMMRFKL